MEYTSFFSAADFVFFPFAIMLLYLVIRMVEKEQVRLLLAAFWIHVVLVVIHALIVQYYYGSGDTTRYYVCILDMRAAFADNAISFGDIFSDKKLDMQSELGNYFINDEYLGQNIYYMRSLSNFTVVRIGTLLSFLVSANYLPIALAFSFIALMGSWVLYKTVCQYYPGVRQEFALGILFLPTICFWSSSILKDPITFGALGFILYGVYLLFIKRRPVMAALLIIPPAYITYLLKAYIIISFAPALLLLILLTYSKKIENRAKRNMMYAIMLVTSVSLGLLLYQNLSSAELANQYQTDQLFQNIDSQREIYDKTSKVTEGAYFNIESSNPVVILLTGVLATYFRPFLWEVQNPVMVLSALESLLFLLLTVFVFYKIGFFKVFSKIFSEPILLFCFIFSILFGAAVGASTGNFGSLVRYKLPGMPFFFIMLIILLLQSGKGFPGWFNYLAKKIRV